MVNLEERCIKIEVTWSTECSRDNDSWSEQFFSVKNSASYLDSNTRKITQDEQSTFSVPKLQAYQGETRNGCYLLEFFQGDGSGQEAVCAVFVILCPCVLLNTCCSLNFSSALFKEWIHKPGISRFIPIFCSDFS